MAFSLSLSNVSVECVLSELTGFIYLSHFFVVPWELGFTDRANRDEGSKGMAVRVYIVRHGETQENRDGVIQGQRDTFLNANGLEQARMVGDALKDAKLGIAFSSDLSRAVKVRGFHQTRDINRVRMKEENLFRFATRD